MRITNVGYGINSKDISSQIKIDNGEIISGRIIKFDKASGEAVLKLVSGGEISAKIQGTLMDIPDNIVKLKVIDIKDSQIKLKLIDDDKIINAGKILIKDNEYLIKILNHNIPLTKENIEFIDSLQSISKSLENVQDIDAFLKDLLLAKGVDPGSDRGVKIFNQLKGFAAEFKELSLDDILNLIENDVELTSDNIKSYNRILKEPSVILKDIEILSKFLGAEQEKKLGSTEMKDKIKEAISIIYDKAKSIMKLTETFNKDNINIFSKNLNDFKVYNSISNNYYYIDTPLKYKEQDCQFKLIIKDDRKRGQIIDKDNVSIAASIKTKNMGTVDVFLKIKNSNMDININIEKKSLALIKSFTKILEKNLREMKYSVNVNVGEKRTNLDLTSYNDFFNDKEFYSLNIYV